MRKLLLLLAAPLSLAAIDLQPWYSPSFEIQAEAKWIYQTFNEVDANPEPIPYRARDNFAVGRLGVSAFDTYDAQLEVVGAQTKAHNFNFDHVSLTLRYLLMDDVEGDFVSWVVGATGIQSVRQAVRDVSSFHHGVSEGEIHTAIGKEIVRCDTWSSHWWITGAIGCAGTGSPWCRGNAYVEYQIPARTLLLRVFAETLWGLGRQDLTTFANFQGYGPIRHRSIDTGARFTYQFPYCGSLHVQYARRVWAKNYPSKANILTVSYLYPFGL